MDKVERAKLATIKELSYAIASNIGVPQEVAFAFLRQAEVSHSARMAHAGPARKIEIEAHYRAWLRRLRAEAYLVYYGFPAKHQWRAPVVAPAQLAL